MFALLSEKGRVEYLADKLPTNQKAVAIAPGWVDIGSPTSMPDIGWITSDNGKTFTDYHALPLDVCKKAKLENLTAQCSSKITEAFVSSALGIMSLYPSNETDQRNLTMATIAPASLWCAKPDGTGWNMTPHTTAQAVQVLADCTAHRMTQQAIFAALSQQVAAASTVDAVHALAWPNT